MLVANAEPNFKTRLASGPGSTESEWTAVFPLKCHGAQFSHPHTSARLDRPLKAGVSLRGSPFQRRMSDALSPRTDAQTDDTGEWRRRGATSEKS